MGEVLSAFVGWVLAFAGAQKLLSSSSRFEQIVKRYRLIPGGAVTLVARVLPWTEIVLGTCLLVGIGDPLVSVLAVLLLFSFALAVSWNLLRGNRDIPCGCFSVDDDTPIGWGTAARGIAMAVAVTATMVLPSSLQALVVGPQAVSRFLAIVLSALVFSFIALARASYQLAQSNVRIPDPRRSS